jgi:hypothetical protein
LLSDFSSLSKVSSFSILFHRGQGMNHWEFFFEKLCKQITRPAIQFWDG